MRLLSDAGSRDHRVSGYIRWWICVWYVMIPLLLRDVVVAPVLRYPWCAGRNQSLAVVMRSHTNTSDEHYRRMLKLTDEPKTGLCMSSSQSRPSLLGVDCWGRVSTMSQSCFCKRRAGPAVLYFPCSSCVQPIGEHNFSTPLENTWPLPTHSIRGNTPNYGNSVTSPRHYDTRPRPSKSPKTAHTNVWCARLWQMLDSETPAAVSWRSCH